MNKLQVIKEYLGTFPDNTTTGTLLENIAKAEELYKENVEKTRARMSQNVGKYFFYSDIDEHVTLIKFIYKVTGIRELKSSKNDEIVLLYEVDMYETGEDGIHHNEGFTMEEKDMYGAKEIHSTLFDKAAELYSGFMSLSA